MRRYLTVLAAAIGLGAPLAAQPIEPADTRAAREAVDRLTARMAMEDTSRATARRLWLERRTLDTLDLAGVRWIVDRSMREHVQAAVVALDTMRAGRGLPPFADVLGRRVAYVLDSRPPDGARQPPSGGLIAYDSTLSPATVLRNPDAVTLVDVLGRVLAANAWIRADLRFRQWAGSAIPLGVDRAYGPDDLRMQLLVSDDPRGWACARGEIEACEAVLLDTTTVAFAGALRAGFAGTALSLGGAASWERLLADSTAPIKRRLEAAARQPLRAISERWYAEVLTLPPQRPLVAGVWVLAIAALGSMFGIRRAG